MGGYVVLGLFAGCATFSSGQLSSAAPSTASSPVVAERLGGDLSIYEASDNQIGHQWVRTSQFLVPVGGRVAVSGLEFAKGSAALTQRQEEVLVQVFNCLEEITENTLGDTNRSRVTEFRAMRFEICGYADTSNSPRNLDLARARAQAVVKHLIQLGTPAWRFQVQAVGDVSQTPHKLFGARELGSRRMVFVRIQ